MAEQSKKRQHGCTRKCGRAERKAKSRTKPLSLYVRGIISAESYFKQTGQFKKN